MTKPDKGTELGLLVGSVGIGERNYWSPKLLHRLAAGGAVLLAPYCHKQRDPDSKRSVRLSAVRYRIETSDRQLAERYEIKWTWAKDLWHVCHRAKSINPEMIGI